jgi:hypothetical protein
MDLTATAEREPAVSTPQEKPVNREGRNRRLGKKSTGQKDARDSRETVPPKERESPAAEEADESPDSPGQSGSERMGFRNIEEEEPVPGDSEDKSGRQRMGFRPVEEE